MKIFDNISEIENIDNTVCVIGAFDGLHLGHIKLIEAAKNKAEKNKCKLLVFTFKTNPKMLFETDPVISKRLITINQKRRIFEEKIKPDYYVEIEFDEFIYNMEADEFLRKILVEKCRAEHIVIGHDFKFGKNRKGDFEFLKKKFGENVIELDAYKIDGITVSSTLIKKKLKENDLQTANRFLGYEYFFEGYVETGQNIGKSIGFPTANIEYPPEIVEIDGIYETVTDVEGAEYKSISHIGNIPTFDRNYKKIETFLFNFDGSLYGKKIRVYLKKFIRGILKFNSIDELKKQIIIDISKIEL